MIENQSACSVRANIISNYSIINIFYACLKFKIAGINYKNHHKIKREHETSSENSE